VLLAAAAPSLALAQDAGRAASVGGTALVPRVTVDLASGTFDRVLPFDVPFLVTGRAPAGTTNVEIQYAAVAEPGDTTAPVWLPHDAARWHPDAPSIANDTFLAIVNPPLSPGRVYRVRFVLQNERSETATRFAEGRTPQKTYASIDVGVLFAGDINTGALYAGVNVYFRPINKDAPLNSFWSVGRRLALTAGLTISSVADENNHTRSDLFWNQSLVLGGGYRLASSLRAGGGVLLFQQADPNPLVSQKSIGATWYTSFSVDLDLLRGIAR
jgi:hypothetical protein